MGPLILNVYVCVCMRVHICMSSREDEVWVSVRVGVWVSAWVSVWVNVCLTLVLCNLQSWCSHLPGLVPVVCTCGWMDVVSRCVYG